METVKTVLAGMIGVRRKSEHEKAALNPVHLIAAGVALAILFVVTLVTIVKIVTS